MKLLGLDIQATEVRVVALKKTRHGGYLVACAETIHLPHNIFVDGQVKQWEVLRGALQAFVKRRKVKGIYAAISLPAHLTMMQRITVPVGLADSDIFVEIHEHLKQSLRGSLEPLAIDFTPLAKDHQANLQIHYTAIRQAHLLSYRQCLTDCGLILKIADVDIYALKRVVIEFAKRKLPAGIHAAVHLVKGVATLIIFNELEIFSHESWDCLDAVDFKMQLQNRLQQSAFKEKNVQQLILCCAESYAERMAKSALYLDWQSRLTFSSQVDHQSFTANANDFLLAVGLAMREVPVW